MIFKGETIGPRCCLELVLQGSFDHDKCEMSEGSGSERRLDITRDLESGIFFPWRGVP